MEKFITKTLFILLDQFNEYKETNYELIGIRKLTTNRLSGETLLYLHDQTSNQEKEIYLFQFRDELLGEIKQSIKDRIEHNEFDEAQDLIEHCKFVEEVLE